MNTLLMFSLLAFAASLVHAVVINGWRQRFAEGQVDDAVVPPAGELPMVSMIIPVRDGAATINGLLQDLYAQRYPKEGVEVIVVDDHSTDATADLTRGMMKHWPQLRLLNNDGEGKKAAITQGVSQAKGALIIITDADARCGADRVPTIVAHWLATNADMVLMPVRTDAASSFLGRVQEDEQAALLLAGAATALEGAPILANGANMAFTRAAFVAVRGYVGDRHASGDDIFLLERMKQAGKPVSYLLDAKAMVTVRAEATGRDFWQQRLRWAGKMRGVRGAGKWAGLLALMLPVALVVITLSLRLPSAVNQGLFRSALLLGSAWLFWLVPVLGMVRDAKGFLGQRYSALGTMISLLAFAVYAPAVALTSIFVRPVWKGRTIR
jgi:cellulose synthase/poly-beta-1,6-N-acetylglucosamine synthase-like glycosyltransferase